MPSSPAAKPDSPGAAGHEEMNHGAMPGMSMPGNSPMPSTGMSGMDHGAGMGKMQGGNAPPNARSPDYSEGVSSGEMRGMDMADNAPLAALLINQLEAYHGRNGNGQRWEAQGWYGNDSNKLWIRTEGERSAGRLEEGDVEAFWNRPFAPFWSTQVGIRQDVGEGPNRTWAAVGVQGLAPYWFDVELTAYVGSNGRTALRGRAEYDFRMTQRLILQPEAEINLYGKNDEAARIGSGVSDMRAGLRLRYEIRRQFAPYIGVNFGRRFGASADYSRQEQQPVFDRQVVAGVRMWF